MTTPIKKSVHRDILEWKRTFNTAINSVRATIERVISHLKNRRILHTDYRRPPDTFTMTISAVVGLHFYTLAE